MKRYEVEIARTETAFRTVEIEAGSEAEAEHLALKRAGDLEFGRSGEAGYDINHCERLEELVNTDA